MRIVYRALSTAAFLIALSAARCAYGQGGATGAISGTVVDTSGGSVAGADVQIIDTRTETVVRKLPAGSDGSFVVPLLPPGTYSVVVNKSGFSQAKADGIAVRVTETTKVTMTIKAGSVSEKVELSARVTTVETTNATTGQSLGTETVRELPLATQNYQQLLTLSTGAQSELNAAAQLGRGSVKLFVNGQREDNNNFLIEGISATDYNVAQATYVPLPNPDVIQEFKVQTSLYDASQGRNGGGNVNAILKSGSREYHGDLYEFFRNDVLNANDFFLNRQGQARPVVKQNIFGASVGGPVLKEKAGFFFVNYQGTRQRSGLSPGTFISTGSLPVLPSANRGDPSYAQTLVDTFFPGDPTITAASIDPVALKLLNFRSDQFNDPSGFLFPSADPVTNQFAISKPGRYTDDQFTLNYDKDFRGGLDRISGRFFFTNFESVLPFGAGGLTATLGGTLSPGDLNFPLDLPVHDRFLSVAETHLFSPFLVNELRFGYVRIDNKAINNPIITVNDLGINRPNDNLYKTIYKFTFSSFNFGPTPGADQSQLQNNFTILDTVSSTHGKHQLRFGGQSDRIALDKNFPQTFNGELFFFPLGDGFTDFQDFLLGKPGFSFGGSGVSNHEYRVNDYGLFIQDDYKATSDLTINAGLRWELFGAAKDNRCHIGNTISARADQGLSPFVYPKCVSKLGVPGFSGTLSDTTMANSYASDWGPRIGFAYDLFGHHTTSVRGGYGIFYVREDVGTVDQLSFTTPILPITTPTGTPGDVADIFAVGPGRLPTGGVIDPAFIPGYSQFLGFADCATGVPTLNTSTGCTVFDNGQPNAFGDAQHPNGVFGGNSINLFGLEVPRHFVSPSTQQWNLSIQHQLPGNWILEVGYVGTKGTHLRETRDGIQPFDAGIHPVTITAKDGTQYTITTNTFFNANARSRALGLATQNYQIFASDAWSNYHSLQITAAHRFSKSLHFQAAYTWSKSLDATSSGNTAFNTAINDQTNLRDSYGLSAFDRKHRLVINYTWDLPFLAHSQGVTGALLGRWTLSGITTFQSGTPFTIIDPGA